MNTDDGAVVGHCELLGIDTANRSAYLGRVLVGETERRNAGLGHQIVAAALAIAFEGLLLHRVALFVFDFNVAAIRCYEKAGFQREGVLRESRRFGEAYWSLCAMGILENAWRAEGDNVGETGK